MSKAAVIRGTRRLSAVMGGTLPKKENPRGKRALTAFLDSWIELNQTLLPAREERDRVSSFLSSAGADMPFIRELPSADPFRRCRAARYLGYIESGRSARALALALRQETEERVMLFIVGALANLEATAALPDIIDCIRGRSVAFITRVAGLLLDFQSSFIALFPELEQRREREITELLVEYTRLAPTKSFYPYLLALFRERDTETRIRRKAFDCLVEHYPFALNPADHLDNGDPEIARRACLALGDRPGTANAHILLSAARDDGGARENAILGLSRMIARSPRVFRYLVGVLRAGIDGPDSRALYDVFAQRIDYFLLKQDEFHVAVTERIVRNGLSRGEMSDLIAFLNKNRDRSVEDRLVRAIRPGLSDRTQGLDELRMYLKYEVLQKLGLSPLPVPTRRLNEKNERVGRRPFAALLALVSAVFPAFLLAALLRAPDGARLADALRSAANSYLSAFAWYTVATTSIGLALAFLAFLESAKQGRHYAIKDKSFLFRRNLLPSISIIAPAFNEAAGVVESVESLINVNYPDFEIIVVNDGSRDATLPILIERFKLEKTDGEYRETLKTQPVRGLYRNPRLPELTVIDKVNGGKADSLNVGINAASGEYILGIDSDSVLERDALLALTSAFLDSRETVVASGGNIMPANGCVIDRGQITERRVAKRPIPAFQTIEYLRSFMTGRLGWSRLGALMIISGAFGIFRREEVIAINGYLTSREKYEKDTVGEDMELVIRLERDLRERGIPHGITYNCLANCWTEVPSSLAVLKRQRERWQRGLLEILSFHRKMIANPRYGKYGLVGFPYYVIIEVAGAWFELFALIAFLASIATGAIDPTVFRFVLWTNLAYGLSLSALSIFLNERNGRVFPLLDRAALMIAAAAEQAGFRQLVSFFRVSGYVNVLRGKTGWGTMTRRGFTKASKGETHVKR